MAIRPLAGQLHPVGAIINRPRLNGLLSGKGAGGY